MSPTKSSPDVFLLDLVRKRCVWCVLGAFKAYFLGLRWMLTKKFGVPLGCRVTFPALNSFWCGMMAKVRRKALQGFIHCFAFHFVFFFALHWKKRTQGPCLHKPLDIGSHSAFLCGTQFCTMNWKRKRSFDNCDKKFESHNWPGDHNTRQFKQDLWRVDQMKSTWSCLCLMWWKPDVN